MTNKLIALFVFCLTLNNVDASKILIIPAKDSGSHLASMIDYVFKLAELGHSVHLFDTAFKEPKYHHPNLITYSVFVPMNATGFEPWTLMGNDPRRFGNSHLRKDQDFQQMLKYHKKTFDQIMGSSWDLIVLDSLFNPHGYSIAMRLWNEKKIPFILVDTSGVMGTNTGISHSLGRNPVIKAYAHPLESSKPTDYFDPKLFINRIYNTLIILWDNYVYNQYTQHEYMPTIKTFGATDFSWRNLYKHSRLLFTDTLIHGFKAPGTEVSNVVNVGSKCAAGTKDELSEEVRNFIEDPNSKGTIYIAFGSYVRWEKAPERIVDVFVGTLKHFPDYRVVFVHNGKITALLSLPNVLYIPWTNQVKLLNHPKTRVFISHGGLKSLKESICSETPIIVIPLFAEQAFNGDVAVINNFGRIMNKFTINENIFYKIIKEILDNPQWKDRMKKIKNLMLDRPILSLDLAAFYSEKAIRNQDKQIFFKPRSINQGWIVYFQLDVLTLLMIIILFIK